MLRMGQRLDTTFLYPNYLNTETNNDPKAETNNDISERRL